MIKLVKNINGEVVAFGGHEGYEPNIPSGCTLELVESYMHIQTVAELKSTKQAEIDAIENNAFMRRGQREYFLANVLRVAIDAGYTHDDLYGTNPEYTRCYNEDLAAQALRAELKAIV